MHHKNNKETHGMEDANITLSSGLGAVHLVRLQSRLQRAFASSEPVRSTCPGSLSLMSRFRQLLFRTLEPPNVKVVVLCATQP